MKLSQIKAVKLLCSRLWSKPNWRDVVHQSCTKLKRDFTVNGVRFISESDIFDILVDELQHNRLALGHFNSFYISNATGWPDEVIRMYQDNDDYETLTDNMSDEAVEELAALYANHQGFGAHFNKFNGATDMVELRNGETFYVFDNH